MTPAENARSGASAPPDRGIRAWLARVPADDPVDRRNAPMLQVVLLLLASLPPLTWIYRLLVVPLPLRPGEPVALASSLAVSALAVFSFVLIRRGRVQWAVRQLVAVAAAALMLAYVAGGYAAQQFEQLIHVVWLVIAGLMIGRRALWLLYGWIVLAIVLGIRTDLVAGRGLDEVAAVVGDGVIGAMIFLFITIVLDRSSAAFRDSLWTATRRGAELEQANRALHEEMRERERVREQLIHAQKMEAVGRLSSGVAHDFNHLLGLIQGYAAQGRRRGEPEAMRAALDGVESAARRAATVSHKLLNFSRRDVTRHEVFDAAAAMQDMRPFLRQLFDPAVEVVLDTSPGTCRIRFDRAQFELLVINLAANANDAIDGRGRFEVHVHPQAERVRLEFVDTGHGMDEAVRQQALEPFFTTKPAGEGTGLGLAVIANLVAEADGVIDIESVPGKGTSVCLRLPRAMDGRDAPASPVVEAALRH